MSNKAVIRMYTCEPCIFTTEEFEQARKDVVARLMAGLDEPGDRILVRLLNEHWGRYKQAKEINEWGQKS